MSSAPDNDMARTFKALHQPGRPIILANVWDITSLKAVLSLRSDLADPSSSPVKAIATASAAIAESQDTRDEDLTFEQNMAAVARIAPLVKEAGLPLTVDIQDGYGDRLEETVTTAIKLGAVGANIEDALPSCDYAKGIDGALYSFDESRRRIERAVAAARKAGCPDFVINARTDVFRTRPAFPADDAAAVEEAVRRGRAFLEAGATTVFFWGGGGSDGRGLRTSEVQTVVKELEGKVSVKLSDKPDALTTSELAGMGVARVSIGPSLYGIAMAAMAKSARSIMGGGSL